jgi:B12-binding domain/radical SAM domain protein
MSKPDLILLHPPSVYDFREMACFYGPISDLVPSAPIFEMYPIGYMTILGHLEAHGYSVRIINVAMRMLKSSRFSVDTLIKSLNPLAFGIDLHWLPHAHGALELAKIIKRYHPHTPVIFGGLSASYYHEELMEYPQVDYVVRGDSTEEPMRLLLEKIRLKKSPDDVPNLTWRCNGNGVRINELSYSPDNLDHLIFDYRTVIKSVLKHRDLIGHLPFERWLEDPVLVALLVRGCIHNCLTCGGGKQSFKNICGRDSPAYRSPELVAKDISLAATRVKGSVALLGDIRQAGEDYAMVLLDNLRKRRIKTHIIFELFDPAPREFLQSIASAVPNFYINISPESHDEKIRRAFGRHYDNKSLEQTIEDALVAGCKRLDLFFMIGLPKQTVQSVRDTIAYCDTLLGRFKHKSETRVQPYISALSPFLDPGSSAFENPEKYGYRLLYKTLEEHRQALLQPSWKYMLNYETKWMSRDELVDCTYEAALGFNHLRTKYGLITEEEAKKIEQRIITAKSLVQHVDNILFSVKEDLRDKKLGQLKQDFKKLADLTDWEDLKWPHGIKTWKFRIKLACVDIAKIDRVSIAIKEIVQKRGLDMRGPMPLRSKKVKITEGETVESEEKGSPGTFEAVIHQRYIDVDLDEKALKLVVELPRPEGLNMDLVFIQ